MRVIRLSAHNTSHLHGHRHGKSIRKKVQVKNSWECLNRCIATDLKIGFSFVLLYHPSPTPLPTSPPPKYQGELFTSKTKFPNMYLYMSHFSYACKMRCPLNLVLESWEYLWFYWTFCIVILDCGMKLHKLSIHTLVMRQKWIEIH